MGVELQTHIYIILKRNLHDIQKLKEKNKNFFRKNNNFFFIFHHLFKN